MKPCPFCGNDEHDGAYDLMWNEPDDVHGWVRVQCPKCHASGPEIEFDPPKTRHMGRKFEREQAEAAFAAWNKRAIAPLSFPH